jgi:hypothetical protein
VSIPSRKSKTKEKDTAMITATLIVAGIIVVTAFDSTST